MLLTRRIVMAGRVLLEMLPRQNSLFSFRLLNSWGCFSRRSYSTALRVETSTAKTSLAQAEYEVHNRKIPTYEEIKNSPELQRQLAEMYQSQTKDSEFQKLTIESMKWGVRSLGKEEH